MTGGVPPKKRNGATKDYGYEVSSLGWEDGMPTAYLP